MLDSPGDHSPDFTGGRPLTCNRIATLNEQALVLRSNLNSSV